MLSPSFFTPQGWQDALEISQYIEADNPDAAARFLPALEDTCTQLVALPGMGSPRTFQRKDLKGVRILPHSIGFSGGVCPSSSKASRREDLEIEQPVACRDGASFDFHATLPWMLGPALIRPYSPRQQRIE